MRTLFRILWLTFRWCLFVALSSVGFGIKLVMPLLQLYISLCLGMMGIFIIAMLFLNPTMLLEMGAKIGLGLLAYGLIAELCLWLARLVRPEPGEWSRCMTPKLSPSPPCQMLEPHREESVTLDLVNGEWR